MTRSLCIAALVFVLAFPLRAAERDSIDFGGSLTALTGWEKFEDDGEFLLEDTLALWFSAELADRFSLFVQGSMVNSLDRSYLFDLDAARFSWQFSRFPELDSEFTFDAGRFLFSDFSSYILEHKADGVKMEWSFPFTVITLAGGYTGFTPKPNSTVLLSVSDAADSQDDDVTYGPSRLFEILLLRIPQSLFEQDILFSVILQQDYRRDRYVVADDRVSTEYFGLGSEGRLFGSLYLDLFGFLGIGQVGADGRVLSGLYGAAFKWFHKEFYLSKAELRFVTATGESNTSSFYSGNPDSESNLFIPISKKDTGIVFSPRISNITFLNAGYSLFPMKGLQTEILGYLFWRTAAGPISESGIDTNDDSDKFLGPELDLRATWLPYADLRVSAGFGLFFPASSSGGAFLNGDPQSKGTISAVFSF